MFNEDTKRVARIGLEEGDLILQHFKEKEIKLDEAAYIFIHMLGRLKAQIDLGKKEKKWEISGKEWVMNIAENAIKLS